MRIFLTGATGYIGAAVAQALAAAGHRIVGLARSEASAHKLEEHGITAVRGDLNDAASVRQGALQGDAVVHTASPGGASSARADDIAIGAILDALDGTNKPFIYTSGVWVLGNTGAKAADEESPLDPAPLVQWRPAIERRVLEASPGGIRGIVVRPAIVYGRGGGIPGTMVRDGREKGMVRFVGTGENRWSFVHVDDLANLYALALDHAPAGTLLHAADGPAFPVRELAEACAQAAGVPGRVESWPLEEARNVLGGFADALVLDQSVSGEKARKLLGWSPLEPSVLEDLLTGPTG